MRFTQSSHIDINFHVTYEGHQNWSEIVSIDILRVFMTFISYLKIDLNMREPSLCQFISLLPSSKVQLFDFSTPDIFHSVNVVGEGCSGLVEDSTSMSDITHVML